MCLVRVFGLCAFVVCVVCWVCIAGCVCWARAFVVCACRVSMLYVFVVCVSTLQVISVRTCL